MSYVYVIHGSSGYWSSKEMGFVPDIDKASVYYFGKAQGMLTRLNSSGISGLRIKQVIHYTQEDDENG